MVFYDERQRRKFLFRSIALGMVMLLFLLSVGVAFSITEKPLQESSGAVLLDEIANEKKLVLTFDDGPHPKNTRKVVRILERNNVPATFFFIGQNMLENRELVREVYNAGFEIGNHTFTHSRNVHKSKRRLTWELNATQRIIENTIGHSTTIYRPPFLLDLEEDLYTQETKNPNSQMRWAIENGYIIVGVDIDSHDWDVNSKEEVLQNIDNEKENGNILLFHDGGGHVRHSIAALEEIIQDFKNDGYTFVTLAEYLGLSKDHLMPPAPKHAYPFQDYIEKASISLMGLFTKKTITLFLQFAAGLVIARILIIIMLYFIATHQEKKKIKDGKWKGLVTVIIPAFNERENITATVQSVIKNTLRPHEIIVVDDGSTDDTAAKVRALQKHYPELIYLIQTPNGGKATATNIGTLNARGEIIIILDADTIFAPDAIHNLVRHFDDENIGAVAGKVLAVKSEKLIPSFQRIEYIVSQNIEKRAWNTVNAVGVVPGAIGAWRKSDVVECGGYSKETLVEDQDLTLAILKKGKKVLFEPHAVSYTETPETFTGFMKQRFRWTFGSLQCLWKYKSNFFSRKAPTLGWILLPNMVLFNTIIPVISFVLDILAVFGLLFGYGGQALGAYLAFTTFDLIYAGIGISKEKRGYHLLFILPIQRLYYRVVLNLVIFQSLIKAFEGTGALWNKVGRTGQAQRFFLDNLGRVKTTTE